MLGIYVHIPFCKQKCKYCDFNSYPGIADMSSSYADALMHEIRSCNQAGREADTIYIGGGTPTFIDDKYIAEIMNAIDSYYNISSDAEITIECNPGTADFEKLARLKECGINRLSIGCQSADDKILKYLGRVHTYAEFVECFKNARRAGFNNISADLMFGLPFQSMDIWLDTLQKVTALSPEHISAYSLKIEEGTPFYSMLENNELIVPNDDQNRDMYDNAVQYLNNNGYKRYEISNFSKRGYESKHNLKYWQCQDYIGFGAGAYSCIDGKRFSNEYSIHSYISAVSKTSSAEIKDEAVYCSEADFMSEFMFLGLRLDSGVSKDEFKKRFGKDVYDVFTAPLSKHIDKTKTITDIGTHIKIKPEYTYVSNMIMSDFIL